jgi:hypothetical protein
VFSELFGLLKDRDCVSRDRIWLATGKRFQVVQQGLCFSESFGFFKGQGGEVGLRNEEVEGFGFVFGELSLNLDIFLGSMIFGGIFFLIFSGCVSASSSRVYIFSVCPPFFEGWGPVTPV